MSGVKRKALFEQPDLVTKNVSKFLLHPEYSDLTIVCGDAMLPAHKLIICPRSGYFQKVTSGKFKESSDFITLKDKEPLLVKKILEYLYTGDYTIDGPTADTNSASQVLDNPTVTTLSKTRDANADLSSSLISTSILGRPCPSYFHLRMYAESDYLMINGLKDKAKTKFEECFPLVSQKDAFALVIRELYSDPPRTNYHELRQSVSSWLAQKRPGKARTFMLSAVIDREILDESPKFARDLLLALIDRN